MVPEGEAGTALGIFGAGNVGAAVTKFAAPVIMVAYGWKTVALVWAAALAIMGILFFLFTKDDPDLAERRARNAKPEPLSAMIEPLKNVQVWRFSLYYFFASAPSSRSRSGCRATSSAFTASTSPPPA